MSGKESAVVAGFFRIPIIVRMVALPRGTILALSAGIGCVLIAFFSILFRKDSRLAVFLFDFGRDSSFPYPFTIQNLMHICFFIGLGELLIRLNTARIEFRLTESKFLPEDDSTVLRAKDLGPIRQKVLSHLDGENGFLPYLINICILQFQASKSVEQAVGVLNSSLELMNHRLDLRYSLVRYIVWVIPTLGFIGTVVGIAFALTFINPDHMDLGSITANLSVAFNTTIIALVQSAILVFLQQVVQNREELALNRAGTSCLQNLINRLFVERESHPA